MQSFLFGSPASIAIKLDDIENRRTISTVVGKQQEELYVYEGTDAVKGTIAITLKKNEKKLEHLGIKVELIGQVGMSIFATSPTYCRTLL